MFRAVCKDPSDIYILVLFPSPPVRQVEDRARLLDRIQCPQCFRQDHPLLSFVERLSERMSEGPSEKNGPRRFDLLRIIPYDRNADRREPLLLDLPLYQSHGLVADASPWYKQDDIDFVALQPPCDLASCCADQRENMSSGDVPHEPVVQVRNTPDEPFLSEFLQTFCGKNDINVPVGIGMVIVVVGDHQARKRSP